MKQYLTILTLLGYLVISLFSFPANSAESLGVYSARKEALIKPILTKFTQDTGIEVKLITGKADALLTRLILEGEATPADVFITVDAGRLQRAKEADIFQPINSVLLNQRIPVNLRDKDNYWIGLSKRARTVFYNKAKVDPKELSNYESLTKDKWRNRLCIRSSNNIYNQSLIASMIETSGETATLTWIKGIVANFARPPAGGDTDQLKAIAAGVCDIAIANTYYYGRLINSQNPQDKKIAQNIGLFWLNQNNRGTHVNVSGAGIIKNSKNTANAIKLLEYLTSNQAQDWYSSINNEFPVVIGVKPSATLTKWGKFKSDSINLSRLGELNPLAVKLMDAGGWK